MPNLTDTQIAQKNSAADANNPLGATPNAQLAQAQAAPQVQAPTTSPQTGLATSATPAIIQSQIPAAPTPSPTPTASNPIAQKYQQTFNTLQSSGVPAPTTPGAGAATVQQATPPPQPAPPDTGKIDNLFQTNDGVTQLMQQFQQYFSPQNQQQSLEQDYQSMIKDSGIEGLNTQLMNTKNIIDGTEQDIRNEITKAGGFATESQVQALTNARNKTQIQNYNNLLNQKQSIQDQVNTMIGLDEKDRAAATDRLDKQMGVSMQLAQMQDTMNRNAQETMSKNIQLSGPSALYQKALDTGDPQAIQRINQIMGPGYDLASAAAAEQKAQTATQTKENLQNKVLESNLLTDKAQRANIYSEISARNKPTQNTTNINGTNIPSSLSPYLNTASNGTQYIDASTLQGTAKDKTALINQASAAGLKVITNKNTAADLINIQDAKSKLSTIQGIFSNIAQPSALERGLGGIGLTKLAAAAQSDPRKAAAGALQSVGLDILKAISGVQGFRGNQTAVQQVTDHLPKITDTVDTVNQKIQYINALISDRENAALGTTNPSKEQPKLLTPTEVPSGYYQASDGLLYKK